VKRQPDPVPKWLSELMSAEEKALGIRRPRSKRRTGLTPPTSQAPVIKIAGFRKETKTRLTRGQAG